MSMQRKLCSTHTHSNLTIFSKSTAAFQAVDHFDTVDCGTCFGEKNPLVLIVRQLSSETDMDERKRLLKKSFVVSFTTHDEEGFDGLRPAALSGRQTALHRGLWLWAENHQAGAESRSPWGDGKLIWDSCAYVGSRIVAAYKRH